MARFNPAEHPRYPNGRFKPKLSQSVRVSTRSISYNAGIRVPVVPGRAQLYVGALVRVERVQGGDFMKNQINRGVDKVAGRFGDVGGKSSIARLIKGEDIQVSSYRLKLDRPSAKPTFRVSQTPKTRENATLVEREAATDRAPRRRPRTRSTATHNTPSTITAGAIQTQKPKAKKPRKTTRSSARTATSGKRIAR